MLEVDTDRDWEFFAQTDPYWSVLSADEFRRKNLTPKNLDRFFVSGAEQIDSVVGILRKRFGTPEKFDVSLDFGCGVGRLLFALAAVSNTAIGLDVSPTMLELCRKHATEKKVHNIEVYPSDDRLSSVQHYEGSVDLITSFIVLQHISPPRGIILIESLLRMLRSRGCGYLHITFAAAIQSLQHEAGNVTGSTYNFYQRTADGLIKLVRKPAADPEIQMNHYNLNEVMCLFYQAGISELFLRFTNHSNILGAELFFRKP